ncbi:glycosyltransferase family protein [Rossellomorea sp. NS-SX7]|uniref:glycosyltransferase family protein n=1 Tax=Rossellomorea sp. NS-SX7 TaxID=3463856 RepID=UPI004058018F
MTKKIAYYISDYGFGHATRSSGIIKGLLQEMDDIEIMVCNSFAMPFLHQNFNNTRVKMRPISTDIGYILKEDSIEPDVKRLNLEYDRYMEEWDERVSEEVTFLNGENIDLVVTDIVAFPVEAAKKIGIPSVGVSNFTWYTAYEGLVEEEKLSQMKEAYDSMTGFFTLAGACEPDWNTLYTKSFGFFSREINIGEVDRIRKLLNPLGEKVLVYFGLGMKIDQGGLDEFEFWEDPTTTFIVSSNTVIDRENVYRIPSDYTDAHHFIAAADLAITKAGWGTVSEAVIGNTPLLIINRQSMKEDRNTIAYLKEKQLCQTIEWDELAQVKSFASMIREMKYSKAHYQNDLYEIVKELKKLVEWR